MTSITHCGDGCSEWQRLPCAVAPGGRQEGGTLAIHWSEAPALELRNTSTRGPLPARIHDSRVPDPFNATGPIAGGQTRNVFVDVWPPHAHVGVAAALTVTVVNTAGTGYLKVYPADLLAEPGVSTINRWSAGLMLATGLTTRLGAEVSAVEPAWESRLKVTCVGGSTHVVIDLTAFWTLSTL